MTTNCDDIRLSLGVYALGALEPEERVLVEAHLAGCAACRAESEELSGVSAFLGRVSEEDVAQAARPPRVVLDRLLAVKVRRRRITRTLLSLAASVLVIGLGGAVWTANRPAQDNASTLSAPLPAGNERSGGESEATGDEGTFSARRKPDPSGASPMDAPASADGSSSALPMEAYSGERLVRKGRNDPVRATVIATEREGTTTVRVVLSGVAMGTPCRLEVVAADGTRQTAGNWIVDRAAYDESVALPGSTTIPLGSIAKFEIVTGRGRVLLTVSAR
ncbi:hypothetical protein GCM10017673_36350 [Streptosporangium violaceochromogenes]|nr:hypothetical protein GCM10017673_36350 [Streptosporangium violaceochromogenes]